ncbi:unnamed protein product [Didymodactylos carnosus]|uniref:Transcription initiation factor TFIID subunit 10 n=1 Tax=Didymodactylos carnosus TaxID=1234261 RepID=A0A814NHP4_9BILA|nr:unnamed protein product [Didymodactylos carnosus]CAF3857199.1 unnamed protein product [Didymodactylos carnosus]
MSNLFDDDFNDDLNAMNTDYFPTTTNNPQIPAVDVQEEMLLSHYTEDQQVASNEAPAIDDGTDTPMSLDELQDFYSTLDAFIPVIPETVTKYYMRQCALQTNDERLVKLLSVSVQKFISEIVNDCYQLCKLREKTTNRTTTTNTNNATTTITNANVTSSSVDPTNTNTNEEATTSTQLATTITKERKLPATLTLNDLSTVLSEYGINMKKTLYYT